MGILKRFKDIMASNINSLLDKAEDPVKMVDQYMRDLQKDLGQVKAETASVMAEEARAKRAVEENEAEIAKLTSYAERALRAGNEEDARTFLQKKSTLETKGAALNEAYQTAANNAAQMRQMHDKLERDIVSLKERKEAIKAKMAVAKTKERVSEIGSSYVDAQGGLDAFARMEEKANRMLDEANAKAELNMKTPDTAEDLMAKYDTGVDVTDAAVEDELAAMKAKLGM